LKTIREDLDSVIKEIQVDDDGVLSLKIFYPEDFIAFKGHFPEKKILPAVAMIQTISFCLKKYSQKKFILKKIIKSSFKSLVVPTESLDIKIKLLETDHNYKVSVKVNSNESKKCDLRLEYEKDC